MQRLRYIRDFLFLLFVIYFAQGSLYTQGSILSQSALALILAISAFYFVKTLLLGNKKSPFYKGWSALLILNIIGFVFTANYVNPNHFGMFRGILISSLPFFPFYYLAQKGVLKSKHIVYFFLVMIPIAILQFFFNASQILSSKISTDPDVVNNVSYVFAGLIPFVFLIKHKKILAISAMFVLIFFIIQGAKRGALITGAIGLLAFIYFQLKSIEKKNRIRGFFFVLIVIIGMIFFAYNMYEKNQFLISRMQTIGEEGGSSGRSIIYANVFNGWYNSDNFINLLFGFGFAKSLDLSGTGNFAHNDWLELLSNFGLLGIIIYGYLFYTAFSYIRCPKWHYDKRIVMLAVVCMWFFTTLVSMSYTSNLGYLQAIILAYLIGSTTEMTDQNDLSGLKKSVRN